MSLTQGVELRGSEIWGTAFDPIGHRRGAASNLRSSHRSWHRLRAAAFNTCESSVHHRNVNATPPPPLRSRAGTWRMWLESEAHWDDEEPKCALGRPAEQGNC